MLIDSSYDFSHQAPGNPFHTVLQRVSFTGNTFWPVDQIWPTTCFINKLGFFLEHSHTRSFTYWLWLLWTKMALLSIVTDPIWPTKLKILTMWSFTENVYQPLTQTVVLFGLSWEYTSQWPCLILEKPVVYLRRMSSEHITDRYEMHGPMCQSVRKIKRLMDCGEVDVDREDQKSFIPGWCGI